MIHEILTNADPPYSFLHTNAEVMDFVTEGKRIPKLADCPDHLYELMLLCWKQDPSERPQFKDILDKLVAIQADEQIEHQDVNSSKSNYYRITDGKRENNYNQPKTPDYQ